MDKARTAWRSIRKKFVISSRFDPYLPPLRGGPKEASHGFRYPSPAKQNVAAVPKGDAKHAYQTRYYERDDIRAQKHAAAEAAAAAAKRYEVSALHLPRPVWWDSQHEVVKTWAARGLPVPPGRCIEHDVLSEELAPDEVHAP